MRQRVLELSYPLSKRVVVTRDILKNHLVQKFSKWCSKRALVVLLASMQARSTPLVTPGGPQLKTPTFFTWNRKRISDIIKSHKNDGFHSLNAIREKGGSRTMLEKFSFKWIINHRSFAPTPPPTQKDCLLPWPQCMLYLIILIREKCIVFVLSENNNILKPCDGGRPITVMTRCFCLNFL